MAEAQPKDKTDEKDSFVDELKPGTKLMHGQYTIEHFLNAGGFGITYLARDSLDRKIVIKECFPGAFCRRSRYVVQARSRAHQNELKSIVRLFVQEARSLAKLDHPNIVGVHQVFEDNDTAYMALDFVEGRDLLDTIEDQNHGLTPPQIKVILKEVLGAVGFIHDQGILHRDISPDNILINKEFHPVLIDFGAAREEATKQSRVLSALRVVKDGYSPQEFYIAGSEQSPSSDLYALAASFHHLIANEVPPNSQARLAAIASGEQDPYVALLGRFPEYDDEFLAAMDKALAVLPKDRVKSAGEWLEMMDGEQGNVTPLNVAAAGAADTAPVEAEIAAASTTAKKSNMPVLLGSAAAIALLVGVGVMTMTGGSEEEVATAAEPLAPVESLFETPVVVATPDEVVAAVEPIETPEPVATVTPEPVATPEPVVTPEPLFAAPSEPVVAEPAPEEPAITITPEQVAAPSVRPATRPESVEIAAAPEPLPEPVETPRPATAEPAIGPEFPDQTGNRPLADSETAEMTLPATPETVEEFVGDLEVDIAALVPGNEILPEPQSIVASWTVQLPFVAAGANSNIIAQAGPVSPVWVQPGLVITGVNDTAVGSIAQIADVLRDATTGVELSPTVPVTFETLDPASGEVTNHNWILPVVQEVTLSDGTAFRSVYAGSDWRTTVTVLADGQNGGLQVGDVVTSYIPTSESVDGPDSLMNIVSREIENGTDQFMFAVQRDGSLWVASLAYDGATE